MVLGFNNMNMFNMFPMGNMFGMGGFGNCFGGFGRGGFGMGGWGCNSIFGDQAAGFAVGSTIAQVGGMALTHHLAEKKANSTEVKEATVENYNNQIKAECKKLGYSTEKEALNAKVEDDYENAITKANSDISSAKTNIKTYNDDLAGLNKTLADLKTELGTLQNKKPVDNNAIAAKNEAITKQQAAVDTKKQQIKDEQTKLDNANAELKKANDAKEKREKEIKAIQDTIRDLVAKRDKLQAEINYQILDKADGRYNQQTKKENFEMKFKNFGTNDEKLINTRVEKKDIRYIIQNYKDAKTPEEKETWKNRFNLLYKELETKDKTKDFQAAYNIING